MDIDGSVNGTIDIKVEALALKPSIPDIDSYEAKIARILEACRWRDSDILRSLAISEGGLINDEVRRAAWPILLGCSKAESLEDKMGTASGWELLPRHRDEDQVRLDVDRSFIYYPDNQSSSELKQRKSELSDLITSILRSYPSLCYFQGYHDIAQVFLLVLGAPLSFAPVAHLSLLRIRDFMLPTLQPALAQLRLIPPILKSVNEPLYRHLSGTQPFFALSGTLTMYAHDIQSYGDIARLFDALLAQPAVFSVYMFATIVLSRASELFEIPPDEPEMLHSMLSKLPKPLDLEKMIADTVKLMELHPPETLGSWHGISGKSVLKTARWPEQVRGQTLRDGDVWFRSQVEELEWQAKKEKLLEALWRYRRPAGTVGIAVLVGVLSFYMRRSSTVPWAFTTLLGWMGSQR